jgi:hypothetical protein
MTRKPDRAARPNAPCKRFAIPIRRGVELMRNVKGHIKRA